MAGYFKTLDGHKYDGMNKAAEAMENGVFAEIAAAGVKKITAAGDAEFRVQEKTTLWGRKAIVILCVVPGTKEQYFVENEWEDNYMPTYNNAEYECKVGQYVRMRRPVINDEMIMTVADAVYNALNVGDTVKPAVGGSVAKKSA